MSQKQRVGALESQRRALLRVIFDLAAAGAIDLAKAGHLRDLVTGELVLAGVNIVIHKPGNVSPQANEARLRQAILASIAAGEIRKGRRHAHRARWNFHGRFGT